MMRDEFCPNNKMQKLETEFWCHVMVGVGHAVYTDRFHELTRLVPHMVTLENKRIESVVLKAGMLTYEAIKSGSLKKSTKKRGNVGEPSRDGNVKDDNKRPRTGRAFASTTNPVRREYTGSTPKCTNCNFHHHLEMPYRTSRGACFECGDTDHYKAACLRLNRAPRQGGNHQIQAMAIKGGQGRANNDMEPSNLGFSYEIEIASGQLVEINKPEENANHLMSVKAEGQKLKDIVIVRNFLEVFPDDLSGLPPYREIKFHIDLIPRAMPVMKCGMLGKKGKLAPRYVGPFEITERIGPVVYRLRLPQELNDVHDTFYVSNLKKCLAKPTQQIPLEEIQVDAKLNFMEEPVEILERKIKKLKRSRIPIIKGEIDNLTIEQYLALTRGYQVPGVVKPEIRGNVNFEIKSQFMRELREDTFFGNKNDDAHEHVERVLGIVHHQELPNSLKKSSISSRKETKHYTKLGNGIMTFYTNVPPMTSITIRRNVQGDNTYRWHDKKSEEEEKLKLGINIEEYDPPMVHVETFIVKRYSFDTGQNFICVTKELMDALPLERENGSRFRDMIRKEVDSGRRIRKKT
uniref:Tf2-1-like SH3-like domain-containing protein n=1 Tax=Tanacetum cinerariifolium TaxID=118510 RepID=A0A6L2KDD4_TANCI|nr:hypothetical protein [Tanacetum cinerariifolium]